MTTPQITPNSVLMNPAEVNPHAQAAQVMTVAKAKSGFQKAEEKTRSDSVNISKEALRMAQEARKQEEEVEYDSVQELERELEEKV